MMSDQHGATVLGGAEPRLNARSLRYPLSAGRGTGAVASYILFRCARTSVTMTPTFATAPRSVLSETFSSFVQ